jgi:hypothetical protein
MIDLWSQNSLLTLPPHFLDSTRNDNAQGDFKELKNLQEGVNNLTDQLSLLQPLLHLAA